MGLHWQPAGLALGALGAVGLVSETVGLASETGWLLMVLVEFELGLA